MLSNVKWVTKGVLDLEYRRKFVKRPASGRAQIVYAGHPKRPHGFGLQLRITFAIIGRLALPMAGKI